jgi:predicted RNA binding protein YcfA (HicA-like mRNA interferase family)
VLKLRKVSGDKVVRILCNKLGFKITGRTGSHISKELKIGTLKGVLKLAKVDTDEFSKYL